jgi:hypothetical protein
MQSRSAAYDVDLRRMKKSLSILMLAAFCSTPAFAQATNDISTFARQTLVQRSKQITANAADMPADKYNYKSPPDDITFGYLLMHVADINYPLCSLIGGVPAPKLPQLKETDAKDILMERMKASFDFCTTALANLNDSGMEQILDLGQAKMSRAMTVVTLTGTWASHYELQQKYLKENDIPLPSPAE